MSYVNNVGLQPGEMVLKGQRMGGLAGCRGVTQDELQ